MSTLADLERVERELRAESARNHGHGFYEYAKGVELGRAVHMREVTE